MAELAQQKELTGGQERQHSHKTKRIGLCLSTIPHCLNGTDFSCEEIWGNICLIYMLIHQDVPVTCDGCGNNFAIDNGMKTLQRSGVTLEPWI